MWFFNPLTRSNPLIPGLPGRSSKWQPDSVMSCFFLCEKSKSISLPLNPLISSRALDTDKQEGRGMYTEAQQINRTLWRPSSVSAQNRKITQEALSDCPGRSRLSFFYTNTPAKEGRQKSI